MPIIFWIFYYWFLNLLFIWWRWAPAQTRITDWYTAFPATTRRYKHESRELYVIYFYVSRFCVWRKKEALAELQGRRRDDAASDSKLRRRSWRFGRGLTGVGRGALVIEDIWWPGRFRGMVGSGGITTMGNGERRAGRSVACHRWRRQADWPVVVGGSGGWR